MLLIKEKYTDENIQNLSLAVFLAYAGIKNAYTFWKMNPYVYA